MLFIRPSTESRESELFSLNFEIHAVADLGMFTRFSVLSSSATDSKSYSSRPSLSSCIFIRNEFVIKVYVLLIVLIH